MDGRQFGNSWSCCWHGFESRPFLNEVNEVLPLPQVVGCIFCLVQFQLQVGNDLSQVQLIFLFHRIISFNKLCWILPEVKEWSTSISSFLGDVILALLIVSFYLYNNVCLREQECVRVKERCSSRLSLTFQAPAKFRQKGPKKSKNWYRRSAKKKKFTRSIWSCTFHQWCTSL